MAGQKIKKYTQTVMEEIANSITHGLGFGFSVAGLTILVVFASMDGDTWRIIAFTIYGTCLSILYLVSTLYHSLTHSGLKPSLEDWITLLFIYLSPAPILLLS